MRLRKSHDFNPEKFLAADEKKKGAGSLGGVEEASVLVFPRKRRQAVIRRIRDKCRQLLPANGAEACAWALGRTAIAEIEAELASAHIRSDEVLVNHLLFSLVHDRGWKSILRSIEK